MKPATPKPRPRADASTLPQPAEAPPGGPDPTQDPWTNRRASEQAHRAASARQVSGRRRFVDPTTCEREYSGEEMEFMQAMQDYKKSSGRMFPTWSEVLEVLRALGYQKGDSLMDGAEDGLGRTLTA